MLRAFDYPSAGSITTHCLGLIVFTILMLSVAWFAFRRLEQNS